MSVAKRLFRVLGLLAVLGATMPATAADFGAAMERTVAAVEKRVGGRVGVSVTDLGTGRSWSHRGEERFPIASTFKAFSCGHLLSLADTGAVDLDKHIRFDKSDLLEYAPVTKERVDGGGMSLLELCSASTSVSDNTAANLVLQETGGPQALTRFMRSIGDETTRLDRDEPELNDVGPGEERDTTSPDAAASSLETMLMGDVLSAGSRAQLETWLVDNAVGGPLLRASLPEDWRIADRTGASAYGSRGIIAVIWPDASNTSTSGPVVAAVYLTGTELSLEERNGVVAEIGAAMVEDIVSDRR